jgi:hypothetical protein
VADVGARTPVEKYHTCDVSGLRKFARGLQGDFLLMLDAGRQPGWLRSHPKHNPSNKEPGIQFADIMGHTVRRDTMGLVESEDIKRILRAIANKDGNQVVAAREDDLHPYLWI